MFKKDEHRTSEIMKQQAALNEPPALFSFQPNKIGVSQKVISRSDLQSVRLQLDVVTRTRIELVLPP